DRPDGRGLGIAVVDHPAPLEPERLVDLAALGAVVRIAVLVRPHVLAIEPGPQLGAERLPVPPGEEAQEECLHGVVMPSEARRVHPVIARRALARRSNDGSRAPEISPTPPNPLPCPVRLPVTE